MDKIKYIVLEHSADILIEVEGKTLGELFRNAAIGMCEEVLDNNTVHYEFVCIGGLLYCENIEYGEINVFDNIENALKNFLDRVKEILYDKRMYPQNIQFDVNGISLYKTLLNPEAVFCDEIKAVTLHMMKITRSEDGIWRTKVLFDV
jgi:SHS2 domain-containing protein